LSISKANIDNNFVILNEYDPEFGMCFYNNCNLKTVILADGEVYDAYEIAFKYM
jgi:hypothetical protein